MNVAYVVSVGPYTLPDTTRIAESGGVYLYRYDGYSPTRVHCEGCQAKVLSFKDRKVAVDLSGLPAEGGWVRLPISPFPRWKAYNNGRSVEIHPWNPTPQLAYMSVHAHNGSLTFRYERQWPDWVGDLLSVLMLVFLLIPGRLTNPRLAWLFGLGRRPFGKLKEILAPRLAVLRSQRARMTLIVLGILLGAALLFGVRRFGEHSQLVLSRAAVSVREGGTTHRCRWFYPQRFLCGEGLNYVGVESRLVGGEAASGIFLHPGRDREYSISWDGLSLSDGLRFDAAIDDAAATGRGLPVTITATYGGTPVGSLTLGRPRERRTLSIPPQSGRRTLKITFTSRGKGITNCLLIPTHD